MVHSDGKSKEETLADFLIQEFPEMKEVGEPMEIEIGAKREKKEKIIIYRPGIVHRLDKETSGILIVAKNQKYFEFLKNLFQERQIQKTYHAFVYGNIKEDSGEINFSIGRSKKDFRQYQTGKLTRGEVREALTFFKILKRSQDKKTTFVEFEPKTGRTHQIRVHARAIQHSIVSDSLYAPNMPKMLGFKRLALHARSLKFRDGIDDYEFVADYPDDFEKAFTIFVAGE
jgi:23S rRNA pseudouridine1911/1915/1917 synthase